MKNLVQQVKNEFINRFDGTYKLINSPGRVNLIGGHTDYNQGYVLPAAVDKNIILAMGKSSSQQAQFYAIDKDDYFEGPLTSEIRKSNKGWPNYLLGIHDQLQKHGYNVGGFNCVFGGDIPIGAGMSSSAALGCGILFGLAELYDLDIGAMEMAQIAQKSENDFVGVQCGIMDQFVCLNGKKDHALKLDCRSLEYEYYPLNRDDIHVVLCDTGVRRELASSEYNVRRSQCEQGVSVLQEHDPSIQSLRDVGLDFLMKHKGEMDAVVFKRCKYIVEENERVLQACHDLDQNNLSAFGQRMNKAHQGLRYQYEVSCKELDALFDIARDIKGVIGSRMMGGGFGGCTINLIQEEHVPSFVDEMNARYTKKMSQDVDIYRTKIASGTALINEREAHPKT